MKTTVLLTGGCGFIGSHVCLELLKRPDHRVVVIDNLSNTYSIDKNMLREQYRRRRLSNATKENFAFYERDFTDAAAMREVFVKERPSIVCHLGAKAGVRASIENPFMYIHTNISGTVLLMELSREFGVKNFVYASSSSVYGKTDSVEFSENDKIVTPVSPYAATKASTELMAHVFNSAHGLKCTGLRFFTVYGPRGRPDMAPYMFVDRIYRGVPIRKYGDGSTSRDYTFVSDIVRGVCAAIDTPRDNAVYNLGNCNTITLNEFIALVERLVGKTAVINQMPMQTGDVERTCADLTHSTRDLGYTPHVPIEEGMRQLVDWYLRRDEEDRDDAEGARTDDDGAEDEDADDTASSVDTETEADKLSAGSGSDRAKDESKDSGFSDSDDSGEETRR